MGAAARDQRRSGLIEGAVITAGVVILRLPPMLLSRWYDPDEAAIAMQGLAMQRGGTLYVAMADRKPPLPPMLYELSFRLTDSSDIRPLRILVALMLAAATIVLVRDVRRTHGQATSLWAGALYVLGALAFSPVDAGAANYAHFALPFATIALVTSRRSGLRWGAIGGVFLGLAILSRQSWIFALPAGAFSAYRAATPTAGVGAMGRLRGPALVAAGCVLAVASCGLFVPLSDFWYWNFASSPGFVFASLGIGAVLTRGGAATVLFIVRHVTLVGASLWGARRSMRTDIDLWLWTTTGLVATAAGFRFYGHYWLQIVPPLTLLAAPVLARATVPWRRLGAAGLAIVGVMSWALLFTPAVYRDRISAAPVATYIREHTAIHDRVFIWGTFPELSVESERPAAGRLVHSDFVTGRSGGRDDPAETLANVSGRPLEMMMDDLRSAPPEVVVDTTGVESLGYTNYPISLIAELAEFVSANYEVETTIDGFTILRLRS